MDKLRSIWLCLRTMKTAKDKVIELIEAGDDIAALRIVAKWHNLGNHKEAITRGWAARTNASFYRQIEKDPDAMLEAGIEAMKIHVCG